MRIAVCRPQVPFAYGGAEIFTDTLVEQLRARGHEAEIVSVPFKWYPGTQVLTQAFTWRLLDLTESDGQADRHGRGDEVPVVRRAAPREAGLARAPVPAGLRARPHRAGAVRRERRGPGACAARCRISTASRSARRAACSPPPATSPAGCSARRGSSPRCCPIPAQELDYHDDGPRGLRPLGQPARSRQARRPADRGSRARALAPGRRRRRGAGRRPAAAARAPTAASTAGSASRAASTRRSWPTSTPRASPPTTRRSTRTSASGRTSRSSPASR